MFNMREEELKEYGTVEEKRRYIAEKRAEDPNWVNTIFPRGKFHRGEPLIPCHTGQAKQYMNITEGMWQERGRRSWNNNKNGAKPRNGRKARAH